MGDELQILSAYYTFFMLMLLCFI
uniref:Uncharacterized protein n=1 Tax=Anguilla anguilla TaxID=7936 RepID=A0A0E9SM62_ANGAN